MEVVGPCVSGGYAATAITASSSSASGLVSSSAAETASSSDSVMVSAPRQRAGGVADESGQLVAGHRGDDLFGDKRGPDAHIGVPLAVTARPVLVAVILTMQNSSGCWSTQPGCSRSFLGSASSSTRTRVSGSYLAVMTPSARACSPAC